jgi:hypothetical protein
MYWEVSCEAQPAGAIASGATTRTHAQAPTHRRPHRRTRTAHTHTRARSCPAPQFPDEAAAEAGDGTVMARMMNAEVEYGYEYLGNSSRLVVTPLTDR